MLKWFSTFQLEKVPVVADLPAENVPFDQPFSAGEFAKIHPSSLVVDFEIEDAVLKGYNERYSVWDQAIEERRSRGEKDTFDELPAESKDFLSRHAHELDHVNRFLGTSFGLFCDTIRHQWLIRASQLVQERSNGSLPSLFPQDLFCFPPQASFAYATKRLRQLGATESKTELLFVGLSHLLSALIDDASPAQFALALFALCNGSTDDFERLTARLDLTRPYCAAFQTKDETGTIFALKARHIIELFAVREQGNSLLSLDASLDTVNKLLKETKDEYILAHLVWCELFPDSAMHPTLASVELDWIKSFPFELFVAADLALWAPFLPDTGVPLEVVGWAELHPAHRFVRVLRTMKRLAIVPGKESDLTQNEHFVAMQEAICSELGWLTPQRIAARWHDHLASMQGTYWPVLDGASTFRMENAIRLLGERLKQPAAIALNNVDAQSLGIEGASAWILGKTGGGRMIRPMAKIEYSALVPYWMMESVQQLASSGRTLFTDRFEPLFRKTAADLAVIHLGRAGRWNQRTADRFRDETKELFNLE